MLVCGGQALSDKLWRASSRSCLSSFALYSGTMPSSGVLGLARQEGPGTCVGFLRSPPLSGGFGSVRRENAGVCVEFFRSSISSGMLDLVRKESAGVCGVVTPLFYRGYTSLTPHPAPNCITSGPPPFLLNESIPPFPPTPHRCCYGKPLPFRMMSTSTHGLRSSPPKFQHHFEEEKAKKVVPPTPPIFMKKITPPLDTSSLARPHLIPSIPTPASPPRRDKSLSSSPIPPPLIHDPKIKTPLFSSTTHPECHFTHLEGGEKQHPSFPSPSAATPPPTMHSQPPLAAVASPPPPQVSDLQSPLDSKKPSHSGSLPQNVAHTPLPASPNHTSSMSLSHTRGFATLPPSSNWRNPYTLLSKLIIFPLKFSFQLLKSTGKFIIEICKNPLLIIKHLQNARDSTIHMLKWAKTGVMLFYANLRVSYQLIRKKILGYPLRFNEHKLLVRTTTDALKLIPFSLFIIIPFAELAIPIVLRLYPSILPSTFFEKQNDHANLQRKLKAKTELAEFFQELIHERTMQILNDQPEGTLRDKASLLQTFQEKLLQKGESDSLVFLSLKETLQFAKLFKSEFVMEKMTLQTLQVMSRLLGIEQYGTHTHVALRLRHHLINIQREDREILWEGVESLSHEELTEACKDRGMRFYGISDDEMREQLTQWLELSSHKEISPLLLIWSRCITMTHQTLQIDHGVQAAEEPAETEAEERKKAAAELAEANLRLQELRKQEIELKETIRQFQAKKKEEKEFETPSSSSSFSTDASEATQSSEESRKLSAVTTVADKNEGSSAEDAGTFVEEHQFPKEQRIFPDMHIDTGKGRISKEVLMRHFRRMTSELKLLREISGLQNEQLNLAANLLTSFSGPEGKSEEELATLIATFQHGLTEVQALLDAAKARRYEDLDLVYYPADQSIIVEDFDGSTKPEYVTAKKPN